MASKASDNGSPSDRIERMYSSLLKKYGPQGWWPLSGRKRTKGAEDKPLHCPKHRNGPPLDDNDRFEIIVGAILTQNTNWKNVEKAIANLNAADILNARKIQKADVKRIAELIRPAGYYNQKAERLKIASDFFSSHFKNRTVPSRAELLQIKGIGPETADSILLYAFGVPTFVVDTYTKRIFSGLGVLKAGSDYERIRKLFMEAFKTSETKEKVKIFKEYHALIVEHAKTHYSRKPYGTGCPLIGPFRQSENNENQPLGAILGLKAEVLRSSPKRLIFGIKNCAINGGVSHPAQFLMTKE